MKAIVLAAGRGSRLKSLTEEKPKCLMQVRDRTLIEWQIFALQSSGISDISVVTGYRAEMLDAFPGKKIFNPRWDKANMVVSLLAAKGEFTDQVIVTYSDILYSPKTVLELTQFDHAKDLVITYDLEWKKLWETRFADPLADAESFKIGKEGRVLEIGQKAKTLDDIRGQYMGLLRFSPKAFSWFIDYASRQTAEVVSKLDMTGILQCLIEEGHPVFGMPIRGGWCEIDTPKDLRLAQQLFA